MSDTRQPTPHADERDERVGQILNEFLDRRARGEAVDEARLLDEHADVAAELREHLALLCNLRPATEHIDALIIQGILTRSAQPEHAAELGTYRILDYVGRGGMGIVLKAFEPSLNRTVALKILRPEFADDETALRRFEREARAAAALDHPNIVTVHSIGVERGVHYIAMEYVNGTTLAEVIRGENGEKSKRRKVEAAERQKVETRGKGDWLRSAAKVPVPFSADATTTAAADSDPRRLPTDLVRHIFRELLLALDAAHAAGLIHRDVKPSNILLGRSPSEDQSGGGQDQRIRGSKDQSDGAAGSAPPVILESSDPRILPTIKLADFGLARMRSSTTQLTISDSALGTPDYMSPEQARGDKAIDHRSDLYSAGVVLYEMLSGRRPFGTDTATATIHRILHEEPTSPLKLAPDIDPHLASVALRLLAKRPDDRLASASEALRAIRAGERVRLVEQRRRALRRTAKILGGLIVVVAGSWWVQRTARTPAAGPPDPTPRPLTAVWIDERQGNTILARYGHDRAAQVFYTFPPEETSVITVALLDPHGDGGMMVAVGTEPFEGHNLFAFDERGHELWRLELTSDIHWPDCAPPTDWKCTGLTGADVDGMPGDELLAVAKDRYEYPTSLSLIDPRGPVLRATYWHMGELAAPQIVPGFFGPDHPAIITHGLNNKLDGFLDRLDADEPPRTRYDFVCVAMVLDPADLEGLAPPRTGRLPGLPAARPYAYAFLDQPPLTGASYLPDRQGERVFPAEGELARIHSVSMANYTTNDEDVPWLAVALTRTVGRPGPGVLVVDRHLAVVQLVVSSGVEGTTSEEYWRRFWQPIVQRYRDVPPSAQPSQDAAAGGNRVLTTNEDRRAKNTGRAGR